MKAHLIPTTLSILVATSLLIGASAKAEVLSAEEQQFIKKAAADGLDATYRDTRQWFVAAV